MLGKGAEMIIRNVKMFTPECSFEEGTIYIRDGKIEKTEKTAAENSAAVPETEKTEDREYGEILDGKGCYAIPGLIDLHFHGCMGYDFCDGTKEAIAEIARYEASVGVTSIAPATMTLPVEELKKILSVGAEYQRDLENDPGKKGTGADLVGINMEGPFISAAKKGAQDPRNIVPCDSKIAQEFLEASDGLVKFIGIAPEEQEDPISFVKEMKERVNVSLAHTNADYEQAKAAFDAGASHAVHLFNAMPAFTHRSPGVVGAVADCPHVTAELICDGVHIHPAMVRAVFRMLGEERMILISDSMRATGMPDGRYTLGGLEVDKAGNLATLVSDGAIAGSATHLMDCLRVAVTQMQLPLETAVRCANLNPAKKLGISDRVGTLEAGKKADVVLLDQSLVLKLVVKDGKKL